MRTKEKEKENGRETRTRSYAIAGIVAIAFALIAAMMVMPAMAQDEIVWEYTGLNMPITAERLTDGNTLIAEKLNNRIIEVTPDKTIVWECNASTTGLYWPMGATRLIDGNTLIADYKNNRVIEVDQDRKIVWECNASTTGLNKPVWAERLTDGNTLIADQGNNRVIEVTPDGTIVWEFATITPWGIERLTNGNTLIASFMRNRVIEVAPDGTILWEYSTGLYFPMDAQRLSNGNTLIADTFNSHVIEMTSEGTIVWEYSIHRPSSAERLANGNTLIAVMGQGRIIEVGTPAEPDLVVEKSVEFNEDGKFVVSYTVTNIGDGPAGESTTCKYVNDQEMEREPCPALSSGESYSGTFEPEPCPCGAILNVTVCADNDNVVEECNETNNCEVNIVECPDPWAEINAELDSLKGNVSGATMPSVIKHRLIDKLEYAKALKENAKIECKEGNFDGATKKLGVAKSQVESFASMVKITRRISPADKASFLADSTEIIENVDELIEYIETEHKC